METSFLDCRREEKEFTFLGLPIEIHPIRLASWDHLLRNINKRLASWKGWLLSFRGRITLSKSVLGSLAIFTLSFYKAPNKVIKDITRIQSDFLLGGTNEKRPVHWVCWDMVCLPTEKGGWV